MRQFLRIRGLPLLGMLAALVFAGCATSGPATEVAPGSGPIVIQAGDFSFAPAVLHMKGAGTVTLRISNDSGTEHNFTLKDPAGKVIASVELPPKQATTVAANLAAPGSYTFDCNKPLHATLGMKGRIVVTM